jgi:hypothetical protein
LIEASQKDHFAVTLGRSLDPQLNPGPSTPGTTNSIPGFGSTSAFYNRFFNLAYIHTLSPNVLNEFRVTGQRSDTVQDVPSSQQPTSTALGINIKSAHPTGPTQLEFPNAVVGFSIQGPSRLTDNTFAYSDVFSWTRGRHTFKFGGSFSAYQDNQVFDFEVNGVFQFAGQDGNGNTLAAGDPFANLSRRLPQPSALRTASIHHDKQNGRSFCARRPHDVPIRSPLQRQGCLIFLVRLFRVVCNCSGVFRAINQNGNSKA